MSANNSMTVIGRLAADPVGRIITTANGDVQTAQFTVMVDRPNRRVRNENGQNGTDGIPVVAYRQAAEFVLRYRGKGQWLAVEGSLQVRSVELPVLHPTSKRPLVLEGKPFTQTRKLYELVADDVRGVGPNPNPGESLRGGAAQTVAEYDESDLSEAPAVAEAPAPAAQPAAAAKPAASRAKRVKPSAEPALATAASPDSLSTGEIFGT